MRFATDWANYASWALEHFTAIRALHGWARRCGLRAPWRGMTTTLRSQELGDCAPVGSTLFELAWQEMGVSAEEVRRAFRDMLKTLSCPHCALTYTDCAVEWTEAWLEGHRDAMRDLGWAKSAMGPSS